MIHASSSSNSGNLTKNQVISLEDAVFENTEGAGCVYSSGSDALRWLRFHMRERREGLVAPAILRELHHPHTIIPQEESDLMHRVPEASLCAYCLGWWTSEFGAQRIVQHSGSMFGWRAQTSFVPNLDIGIAVYLNIANPIHHAIAYMVLEKLMTLEPRDWVRVAKEHAETSARLFSQTMERLYPCSVDGCSSSLSLISYEDRYAHPAAGIIEIEERDGGLLVKQMDGRLWDIVLRPLSETVFEAQFAQPAARDYLPAAARACFVVEGGRVVAFEETTTRYERCG